MDSPSPDLFDRRRRALRRCRRHPHRDDFIGETMAAMVIDRLSDVSRTFTDALVIGARSATLAAAVRAQVDRVTLFDACAGLSGVTLSGDEDRLPVDPAAFDLIIWAGGLDSVNDVPGALLRCRLALRDDGLLIGCFAGDGSFPALRAALAAGDAGRAVARMHPQIDVRALGDLLARAGLAMTVVDVDRLSLAYRDLDALAADLRAAALTNVLAGPVIAQTRSGWVRARQAFSALAGADERIVESLNIVHFSGWAPHPDQARPARRGSATVSLAAALKPARSVGE